MSWFLAEATNCLVTLLILQVMDGGADSLGGSGVHLPAPTSVVAAARSARPDTGSGALDAVLTAVRAHVLGALQQLNALDELTESSTVSGTVLTGDTNLLRALGHLG